MAATVSQIASGLMANLSTISGLRTFAFQPEQLNPPFAFPVLTQVKYHGAMGGGDVVYEWTVHAIVGRYTDRSAYQTLDGFISYDGATSLRAALESDRTLGGVAQTLLVSSALSIDSLSAADAEFLQVQISVTVHG